MPKNSCIRDTEIALLKNEQSHIMDKIDNLEKKVENNHQEIKWLLVEHMRAEEKTISQINDNFQILDWKYATKLEHQINADKIWQIINALKWLAWLVWTSIVYAIMKLILH